MELLRAHGVEELVDIRSVPRSRRNPQFNRDMLPKPLERAGIGYVHMPALGGLRRPRADSPNTAWQNASFRGYADYMQMPAFARALDELIRLGAKEQIAIMCADALTAHGVAIEHIMSVTKRQAHRLTPFAKIEGTRVWYPGLIA